MLHSHLLEFFIVTCQIISRLHFLLVSGLTVLPPDEVEVEQEDEEEILVWALLELANGWPHPASLLHTSTLSRLELGPSPASRQQPGHSHSMCSVHSTQVHTAIYLGN